MGIDNLLNRHSSSGKYGEQYSSAFLQLEHSGSEGLGDLSTTTELVPGVSLDHSSDTNSRAFWHTSSHPLNAVFHKMMEK